MGNGLTYSASLGDDSVLPNWIQFDSASRTFTFNAATENIGSYELKVLAANSSNETASDIFDLVVKANEAPTFNEKSWDFDGSRERLYGQVAVVNRAANFVYPDGIFNDKDNGDTLTYSATLVNGDPLPAWLSVDPATGAFSGTPDSVSNLDIKLIATDTAGNSDSANFTLDVLNNTAGDSSNPGGINNNLQLWLRGDAGVVESDGNVSAWLDQSDNNFYASQSLSSYRPVVNNNGLNGQPTLSFDADTLLNRGLLGDHLDVAFDSKLNPDEFTVFTISSVADGENNWRSPVSSRGSQTGYNFYAGTDNKWQFWTGNGNGWNRVSGNAPVTLDEWELVTGAYDGTNQSLRLDGRQTASSSKTYVPNTTEPFIIGGIGSSYYAGFPFQGDVAEVLVFDTALGEAERNRVDSYLAVKYGLSLDQTTATNYTASDSSIWWNATAAGDYQYNIAGVVSDAGSNLVQTQSRSSNLDGIVAVELENVSELTNGESLFWSDDGVSADVDNISSDVPSGYDGRLAKVWQVAETGEVGNVILSFDLSGLGYSVADASEFALLTDSDANFSDAIAYTTGRSLENQTISFTSLDLDAGQYFTLAATNTVNRNPTGTDNLVTTNEDVSYSFTGSDFGFSDADAGDTLAKVLITRLPQHGILELNNVAVTENQSINIADIPNLTFTPNAEQFGEEYTNFEFKVNDGEADSLDANEMTVTVNPVVDAEEIASSNISDVDDATVVDVMIVYTQGALDQAGSLETLNNKINSEVDLTNEALTRSGVNFTVNIVATRLVENYVGVATNTDLGRINNPNDGFMDEVHDWRDEESADFVSLWSTGGGAGNGYQPGAYHSVTYGTSYNFDHELAHNLGAVHDVYNGGNPTNGRSGYKSLEERIATVQSYGQGGTTWTQTFSSPNLIINDVPFGSEEADNVARMNELAMTSTNRRHSNDNLANAAEITSFDSIQALNGNATKEDNELDIADNAGGKSVWWSWTAPNSDPIEITTAGSNFDTLLAVYTGTEYSNLQLITQGNDTGIDSTSKVAFTPTAGETYKIAVAGENNSSGQIQLNFATLPTLPVVRVTATDNEASEATLDTASFRIQRGNSNGDLTVNLALTGTKGTQDYILSVNNTELTDNSVTIPDGQNFVDVLITPIDDNATETGGETLSVEVVSDFVNYLPANAPNNRSSITILDDDTATPGGLDANNLQLWLDGSSQVDTDSDGVTTWRDRSSSGIDLGQENADSKPILQNNGLNYNPVISFDGSNDTLNSIDTLPADFVMGDASIFIVSKSNRANQRNTILAATPDDTSRRFLVHLPYSGKTYFDRGNINSGGRLSTSFEDPNTFQLWNFQTETGVGQSILRNGSEIASDTNTSETFNSTGKTLELSSLISPDAFEGDIAEVIVFNDALSESDRNAVDSYLGIKYGTTLDQTTPSNYVSSDGGIIWNAATAGDYQHDIAGIAVDESSGLNQTQSRSSNSDGIAIVSNPSNLEDGEALIWSNNNDVTDAFNTVAIDNYQKIARQWRVQETGEVGTFNLSFDLNSLGYDTSNPDDFVLLIDDDGDFGNATASNINSTIDGDTVTFTGVDLNHNDYFSLAVPQSETPGNVSDNLQVWLKADSGITTNNGTVANWQDSSLNQRNYSQSTVTKQPVVTDNAINFNPAVTFDGLWHSGTEGDLLETDRTTYTEGSLFFVVNSNKNSGSLLTDNWFQYAFDLNYGIGGKVGINYYNPGGTYPSSIDSPVDEVAIASFNKSDGSGIFNLGIEKDGVLTTDAVDTENSSRSFVNRRLAPSFEGDIAEFILYDTVLNPTEENKVRTYLGIKYGVTLDRNSNYISSDDSIWWDATKDNQYNSNVAGIAVDEASGLNQVQSRSSNDDSILTISNPSNLDNGEALIWGTNNLTASENIPTRIWQVQENSGDVGIVTVSFDLNQLGDYFTNVAQLSDFALLVGDDDSFSHPAYHTTGRSIENNILTFSDVDFDNGEYFTLTPRYNNPELVSRGNNNPEELQGSSTADILSGDNGSDRLYGNGGDDILSGDELNDLLKGGDGNDDLNGGDGSDRLYGENDNDTLSGGNGRDILYGGLGDDFLYGGTQSDFLTGNGGSDTFVLSEAGTNDSIYDYLDGTDKLGLLDGLDFADLTITQAGLHTEIGLQTSGELIGTLYNVDASLVDASDIILV